MIVFHAIHLIVLPCNADNVVPDPAQLATKKDKRPKPWDHIFNRGASTSGDNSGPSLTSTAYSATKVVIDVVKESSDAFTPLKSAASFLSAVLKNYDVWSTSPVPSVILIITPANDGQSANDRIINTMN